MSLKRARRSLKRGQFPLPSTHRDNEDWWNPHEVWSWSARHARHRAAAMPLKYWAPQNEPPVYGGAREITGGVVQDWYVQDDMLRVLWPLPHIASPEPQQAAAAGPAVQQVHRVASQVGIFGPELRTFSITGENLGSADWLDYAHVLGGRAPYWPMELRTAELLISWRPGAPLAVAPAVPAVDTAPLLRLAATLEDGTPAERTLVNLAQTLQGKATWGAQLDLDLFGREARYSAVLLGAEPMAVPEVDDEDLDESLRRAGWLEVLARQDTLAVSVVRALLAWDGGDPLPFSKLAEIDPASKYGKEWAARLEPVTHRTAAFEIPLRRPDETVAELLLDPETDAPVIRTDDGTLLAAVPQRLPAQSPLAEVVLDEPIWVRVQDGTLYIAPEDSYYSLAWGYGGSGPEALALLLHRLLDDINARAADGISDAPDGLEDFTQIDHPRGSVLTREQLAAARDGHPYAAS